MSLSNPPTFTIQGLYTLLFLRSFTQLLSSLWDPSWKGLQ